MKTKIAEAAALRKENKPDLAAEILKTLLQIHPNDPEINYQMAWTCDFMGKESEAVPYYEKALTNGLADGREGALLGLGSTYRCLGEYEKSLKIFDQAIAEYPKNNALKVFRALTLFNLGRADESVRQLLIQLLDTTNDDTIKSYDTALRFYSDKLSETWK